MLHLRDVKSLAGGGDARGLGLREAPWRVTGQHRFKALVTEMRLVLEDARRELEKLEGLLPWHVVHGDQESPARDALVERIRTEVAPEIVTPFGVKSTPLCALRPRGERDALRAFSMRCLGRSPDAVALDEPSTAEAARLPG